jgi:hypothetical protein
MPLVDAGFQIRTNIDDGRPAKFFTARLQGSRAILDGVACLNLQELDLGLI